ncbi:MAG: thioesterase [Fretibacterium sp.]|nr:thioesterase [Fretibacterium sp.]
MYDLRELVSIGQSAKIAHVVHPSEAALQYSKGLEELLSTPALIGLIIRAGAETLDPYLPEGYISIGRSIEFEHSAPTLVGGHIVVETTVSDVQPLFVVLDIMVKDEAGEIGTGKHWRSIVVTEKLLERAKQRSLLASNS